MTDEEIEHMPNCQGHNEDGECIMTVVVRPPTRHDGGLFVILMGVPADFARIELAGDGVCYTPEDTAAVGQALSEIHPHHVDWYKVANTY